MSINLGSMQIPVNAATKAFAVLAKRGAGKTYAAGVLAEEFYKNGIPFVVFDPIDVWFGLRLAANGRDGGLPVVVFGARHADIPLNRDMGRQIAQAIVRENISCVISTMGIQGGKTAERHLIAEFSEELLSINNTPRHVFIEEAHEYVPQRVFGGVSKTFNAVSNLIVMGRNQSIGVTLINQRAATINKDVLTQIDAIIALRSVGPQDKKALGDYAESYGVEDDPKFDQFIGSLPSLPTGEGWMWSPEFLGKFERIKIRKRETFHPDRETVGGKFVMPETSQVDVQGFIAKFSAMLSEKPPKGKRGVAVAVPAPAAPAVPTVPQQEVINLRNDYESRLIAKDAEIRVLKAVVARVQDAVRAAGSELVVPASKLPNDAVALWQSKLHGLAGRIFRFLSEHPERQFTREQVCLAIGVSAKAGHTSNEFSRMMRTGAVTRDKNLYQLNRNL